MSVCLSPSFYLPLLQGLHTDFHLSGGMLNYKLCVEGFTLYKIDYEDKFKSVLFITNKQTLTLYNVLVTCYKSIKLVFFFFNMRIRWNWKLLKYIFVRHFTAELLFFFRKDC